MSSSSKHGVLFIHALTGLHPGSGTALGVVDLPVQRERHTQWPVIPGSSLKGVLRDALREKLEKDNWYSVFGPETSDAHEHAGALAVTDARILAFPVRSLRGVFAWVTCPAVLQRLNRDLALVGFPGLSGIPELGKEKAACHEKSPLLLEGNKMVLEEFEFTRAGAADSLAGWVAKHAAGDPDTQDRIKTHLAVLHDDDFTHFVRHATEVSARIGLDYEQKTVKDGALFYEEFLPPETLFYALTIADKGRRKGKSISADSIYDLVHSNLPQLLQIGGDETIGKGLCAVRLTNGKEA